HRYRMFHALVTWAEARRRCEKAGAHLVTVTDAGEQDFIDTRFWGIYWIGAFRAGKEPFGWVTGERFAFQKWDKAEPDVPGEALVGVLIHSLGANRRWRDRDGNASTERWRFLCEID